VKQDEWWTWYKGTYLLSETWKSTRKVLLKGNCERPCSGARPCCGRLEIHHLHYRSVKHEAAGDVQTVCRECHALIHWATWRPDDPTPAKVILN
jgi:hypothetical protein